MKNKTDHKNSSVKGNNLLDKLVQIAFIILAIAVVAMFTTLIIGSKLEGYTISLISTVTTIIACILTFAALFLSLRSVEISKKSIEFDIDLSIEERKHKIITFSNESIKLLEKMNKDHPGESKDPEFISTFIRETRMLESYPFYRAKSNKNGFNIVNNYRSFLVSARDSIRNNENITISDALALLKNTHDIMIQALEDDTTPQKIQEEKEKIKE